MLPCPPRTAGIHIFSPGFAFGPGNKRERGNAPASIGFPAFPRRFRAGEQGEQPRRKAIQVSDMTSISRVLDWAMRIQNPLLALAVWTLIVLCGLSFIGFVGAYVVLPILHSVPT